LLLQLALIWFNAPHYACKLSGTKAVTFLPYRLIPFLNSEFLGRRCFTYSPFGQPLRGHVRTARSS